MHSLISNQLLNEATAIIASARPLVAAIERRDRDLGNQIRRALNSVVLNVAEGFGCRGGNARMRFESAHGSLSEVRAALSAAVAWQYVHEANIDELNRRLHSLGARLFGLMRR
ncbi:MAG: four helix bundle protein [Polyangiaceae bacterium]